MSLTVMVNSIYLALGGRGASAVSLNNFYFYVENKHSLDQWQTGSKNINCHEI